MRSANDAPPGLELELEQAAVTDGRSALDRARATVLPVVEINRKPT